MIDEKAESERAAREKAYRAYLQDASKTVAFATPSAEMIEQSGDYTDEDE